MSTTKEGAKQKRIEANETKRIEETRGREGGDRKTAS